MKKLIAVLLTLIMALSLAGCAKVMDAATVLALKIQDSIAGPAETAPQPNGGGALPGDMESQIHEAIEQSGFADIINEDAVNDLVNEAVSNGSEMGYTGNDGAELKDVNATNFTAVAKNIYGIEVSEADGFSLTKVESVNGVNDLKIEGRLNDTDGEKEMLKVYFDRCLAVNGGKVFQQKIDWDTFAMKRGTEYHSFDEYYAAEADELLTAWIYDYNGHGVQCSCDIMDGMMYMTLVLLG